MSARGDEAYYLAARRRLDALLELEILRLRARYQLSLDELRGLYISDEQVDRLLQAPDAAVFDERVPALRAAAERFTDESAQLLCSSSRWSHVVAEFTLSSFEVDVLMLSVARELDRKYQTLYAYLNDDAARKWPTRDLALRLFAAGGPLNAKARASLAADGVLLSSGLLQPAGESTSWLTGGFAPSEPTLHYLTGAPALGSKRSAAVVGGWPALDWRDVGVAAETCEAMRRVPLLDGAPIVMLEGREGSGRGRSAAALATEIGAPLVTIDARLVRAGVESLADLVRVALLQQRLHGAVIHIDGGDVLTERDSAQSGEVRSAVASLGGARGVVLVSVAPEIRWHDVFGTLRCTCITFPEPKTAQRLRLWRGLRGSSSGAADPLPEIADRFAFTPGQIARASSAADDRWTLGGGNGAGADDATLFEALRAETRSGLAALGALAARTTTAAQWSDLVLPATTMQQLHELVDAIRHRSTVYDDWGMASRNSGARGIRALMVGPSGTGKTTSSAIIAGVELGVDLYTVDLSAVSSKYIGDTEKHLDRIFSAARSSSAILFFDEADALFGKRSEVKDAHDRYANIEVAYLLQKLDQHDGTIFLATNLASNLDQGFSRRMHYTIEFPFPSEADRERIWRGIFPASAPVADDVDYGFLARQFSIAGGDIRNVALNAAFRAAAAGRAIAMRDLVRAMARQMTKQGRSLSIVDFREHLSLLHADR